MDIEGMYVFNVMTWLPYKDICDQIHWHCINLLAFSYILQLATSHTNEEKKKITTGVKWDMSKVVKCFCGHIYSKQNSRISFFSIRYIFFVRKEKWNPY